jgi:hypothetical protein
VSYRAPAARPLGYLTVTIVWLILFLIITALTFLFWVVPPGALHTQPGFTTGIEDTKDAIGMIVVVAVVLPLAWGFVFQVLAMAFGTLLLAALALWRSLLPGYRGERITGSQWRDDVAGPPRLTAVAISLQPLRHTRYSRWAATLNLRSWILSGAWYLGMVCFGYANFLLIYWVRWPLENPFAVAVVIVFAVAFVVLGGFFLRRGWRHLEVTAVDGKVPTARKLGAQPAHADEG